MLVGKGTPKVAIRTDGTMITERNADEKERCPSVIAFFFGVQQAVVSCVASSSLLYSHVYNHIPKPVSSC